MPASSRSSRRKAASLKKRDYTPRAKGALDVRHEHFASACLGDFLRAVIRARRKAVNFMKTNPDEAAAIVAKEYKIDLDVAKSAVRNLTTSTTQGVPYWGEGQINLAGLKRMIEAQRSVGAISGEVDYTKIIDTRFLPDDLKAIK